MPGLQLLAKQYQVAWQPICTIGADFKFISAHELHMAPAISAKPKLAAGNGFIQQLDPAAMGQVAPPGNGGFARADAVKPVPDKGCDQEGQDDFHKWG